MSLLGSRRWDSGDGVPDRSGVWPADGAESAADGLAKLVRLARDAAGGTRVPGNPPAVASRAGAAPRHVDFHPTQPYAYVINELDSTIATYELDPDKGAFKALQVVTTMPSSYT